MTAPGLLRKISSMLSYIGDNIFLRLQGCSEMDVMSCAPPPNSELDAPSARRSPVSPKDMSDAALTRAWTAANVDFDLRAAQMSALVFFVAAHGSAYFTSSKTSIQWGRTADALQLTCAHPGPLRSEHWSKSMSSVLPCADSSAGFHGEDAGLSL